MTLSSFDSLFRSDEDKAANGIPIPMGTNAKNETMQIWVAEVGNPNHEKSQRRYAKQLEINRKNRDAYNAIVAKIVAESILIKWEGFLDENGQPIESNFANKLEKLIKYKRFMNDVLEAAGDHENFCVSDTEAEKATEGN